MELTAKQYLQGELERKLASAREVTDEADKAGRQMTDDERSKVEGVLNEAAGLKERIKSMSDNEALREAIEGLGTVTTKPVEQASSRARTVGEAFVQSKGYQALKTAGTTGHFSTGPIEIPFGFGWKDDAGFITEGNISTMPPVIAPQRVPGILTPVEQALTVADLFGQGVATSNTIVSVLETATDNAASGVDESGNKPPSYFELDTRVVALCKVATMATVSNELLEDIDAILSYLNARLALFVRQAEETDLVTTLLAGGIGSSDAADIGGDNIFDAVQAGIVDVKVTGGLDADALLISPVDHATMTITKAVAGDGNYFSGGPYIAGAQNPWGLRAVVTTAVSDGSPVVGAFRQGAMLWRKGGLTVEASNSHEDYFERNLVAIRAEERYALDIIRPAAFSVVTYST